MKFLLIRHATTDANRTTRAFFGAEGAPLNATGQGQARGLHDALLDRGVGLTSVRVAVSELVRTRQTAEMAGLHTLTVNPLLNEVNTVDPANTNILLAAKHLPDEALVTADKLLANPPEQAIWVTHGLVIMAVLERLGKADPTHFIPDYCEIVEIEL